MKILFFADLHMCPRASIINKWGSKYPLRLENCINSVNWLERLAETEGCEYIISLGDFFDKPDLTSETITASKDLEWSNIPHISIVGNHDASVSSLEFNSANSLLNSLHKVITEPQLLTFDTFELGLLPYIVESDRRPLDSYFSAPNSKPRIIVSHNDLNGIQLGPVVSKTGFTIEEIEANCDLFLNGHLHNGQAISKKVINLGNITGKDFGEDAGKHSHEAAILDTDTMSVRYIENPFAFNFYKLQVDAEQDIKKFATLKANAVVSVKCAKGLVESVKAAIANTPNILEARVIITRTAEDDHDVDTNAIDLSAIDHLARFVECCMANIDNTRMLEEELAEVCK